MGTMQRFSARELVLTAIFAALTAVGGLVHLSGFSMQVFFTALAGFLLGPRVGAASQAVYVALGLAGLPVFVGGGGLSYVAQPTFGFLLGLVPMAWLAGCLSQGGRLSRLLAGPAALAALYAVGLPYLHLFMRGAWSIGQTLRYGCLIFLPADALKLLCAALLAARLRLRLTRR